MTQSVRKDRRRIVRLMNVIGAGLAVVSLTAPLRAQSSGANPSDEPAGELESYFRKHGLSDLVVIHLESQLQQALGEDQIPLAERLAAMYSEMIDQASTDEERAWWEQKSRALLEQIPAADTEALRLNIYKASYLRAERLAELYRLRAVDDSDAIKARRLMNDLAGELTRAWRELDTRIQRLSEMNVGTNDERAAQVSREIGSLEPLASQAAYYGAWSLYYDAWLSGSPARIPEALELFGSILQTEGQAPRLDELPESLLAYEHVARAVIGVALCHAEAGRYREALDWLDALESDRTHEGASRQAPAFRLTVLADAGDWASLEEHIETLIDLDRFDATLARLLAVQTLERLARREDSQARRLAGVAIARLARLGELRQIIEIADAYDLAVLGDNRFVVMYVLGLKAHERAREAHAGAEPTTDSSIVDRYRRSDELLRRAIARPDAGDFPEAEANARYLLAWSKYYQSRLVDAADAFREVAADLARGEAEDARWMRVVCLDQATRLSPSQDLRASLREAMDDFVQRYPSSQRAYRIRYREVVHGSGDPTIEGVEALLSIPPGSETYAAARHEAERMLYQLFRDASGQNKTDLGQRYVEVATPLYLADQRRAFSSASDQESRERCVTRARRLLDVLLTRGVARLQEARQILDRLESGAAAGLIDLQSVRDEMDYRRFQILALSGQIKQASEWADDLWESRPESPFALAASQTLFSYAMQDWRSFPNDPRLADTLQNAMRYGQRVLESQGDNPDLSNETTRSIVAAVAEAAHELSKRTDTRDARHFADRWFPRLLEAEPRNHRFLKANAEIAERNGEIPLALEHWRAAVNGLDPSETAWFEAKYHMMRLMAETDPARAAEVMRQHRLLHPDYGPRPWKERLAELDRSLPRGETRDVTDSGAGDAG